MDTHLGYGKHEVKAKLTPNSRNGKSRKTVVSEYGEQEIAILGTGWLSLSPWSLRSINPI